MPRCILGLHFAVRPLEAQLDIREEAKFGIYADMVQSGLLWERVASHRYQVSLKHSDAKPSEL